MAEGTEKMQGFLKSYIYQHQNDDEDSEEDASFDPQDEPVCHTEDDDDDLTNGTESQSPSNTPTKKTVPQINRTFSQLSSEPGSPSNPQHHQQRVKISFSIFVNSLHFPAISRQYQYQTSINKNT